MAGIGFTLRRLLAEGGFTGEFKAFGYAALVSSGPWLTSSIAMVTLGIFGALGDSSHDARIFMAIVSYSFCFSLVGVGACQMVASRYLADRLFENNWEALAPAFARLFVPLTLVQLFLALLFYAFVPLPLEVELVALVLYLALNGTWLAMVFLSAAHDYKAIAASFGAGLALSLAGGLWGAHFFGLFGQLAGFTAGYTLTFLALLARLDREFGVPAGDAPGLAGYFRDLGPLVVTGFAYNLGVWVDKLIFWYHPAASEEVAGLLRAAPVYDNAMFMAYLTIAPALAIFLIKVETDFYDQYRAYFATISHRESWDTLLDVKARLTRVLTESLGLLVKIQGTFSFVVMVLAPEITAIFASSWLSLFVFRVGVLGSFLHIIDLILLILLLYFDYRREAAMLSLAFLSSNALFTLLSFQGGLMFYGFGYATAGAVTFLYGARLLSRGLDGLEYHVFMKQPLS